VLIVAKTQACFAKTQACALVLALLGTSARLGTITSGPATP